MRINNIFCHLVVFIVLFTICTTLNAKELPAPFKATGTIVTHVYRSNSPEPFYTKTSKVIVLSSNSWWRIQTFPQISDGIPLPPNASGLASIDTMRIPDGVRSYNIPAIQNINTTNGYAFAKVYPLKMPPPEHIETLLGWLAFCPSPELPTLKSNQIHCFLESRSLLSSTNLGYFAASFLNTNNLFLSKLSITNKNVLNHEYEVLTTTNVFGFTFPLKACLKRFISAESKNNNAAFMVNELTLTLDNIELLNEHSMPDIETKVIAEDIRPLDLPHLNGIHYSVTNDKWMSLTNKEIQSLIQVEKAHNKVTKKPNHSYSMFIILIVLFPFAVYFIKSNISK